MSLGPGTRVGAYEITEVLGEGGMGTVYRAHDARLQRDVAIKVIRADLAADSTRVARFEREARLLASLSHPHIATVHGLEQAGDTRMLVLELVPGLTLSERLHEGPLPVHEALTYGMQIAAAIEAAHDGGVIHRDLKPANVKITPSGIVKVLDFGLAKALAIDPTAAALAMSPTLTSGGTGEGVILGTAAYMSPEQARGKDVDKRTDVWAFGCVLYDMLTGKPAFAGDTLSDTIAAILTRDPDWTRLPADLPASIARLLRRCLQKDVHRRLRDMGDARIEIEEALGSSSDSPPVVPSSGIAPAVPVRDRRRITPVAAGALLAGVLAGAAGYAWFASRNDAPEPPTVQFPIALAGNQRVDGLDFPAIAVSPSGTHIVLVATRGGRPQLFLRPLGSLETQPLADTEGALAPFFSPDGRWIAFFSAGKLKKIPLDGGSVRDIAEAEIGFGGVWAPDNTILFAPNNASGLMRVSADGGAAEPVTTLDEARSEFSHRWPDLLPDGKTLLFTAGSQGSWDDGEIVAQEIGSKERTILVSGGTSPRYSPTGHVLYTRDGMLNALPFDAASRKANGSVLTGLAAVLQSVDGAAQISISRSGALVYVPGSASAGARTLTWVDRSGNPQPLAAPPRAYTAPRLSPDGRTIALTIAGETTDVWTYDIAENTLNQLTFGGGSLPVWERDDKRIAFSASRGAAPAVFSKTADGSGGEQRLTSGTKSHVPHAATPDGGILFVESDASGRDVSLAAADHTVRPVLATGANESAAAVSNDGRWLAFVSDTSGRAEVYVAPFDQPSRAVQVSNEGGTEPAWKRDGGELYFRSAQKMMAAVIRTQPRLAAEAPRELFSGAYEAGTASRAGYDVSPDGMRFLLVRASQADRPGRELRVVLNWRPR